MQTQNHRRDIHLQIVGWVLFIICALLFILSSLKNHDALSLAASLVFLFACFRFMIPRIDGMKSSGNRD
jgi:hypothetical protein